MAPSSDPPVSIERTILARAHQTVENWRHWRASTPLTEVLTEMETVYWKDTPDTERERAAFRQVAAAIQRGRGHAVHDPEPLLAIVRAILADE